MQWLRKVLGRTGGPELRGRPAVRRQKNYLAMSGYAYEYFHEGLRDGRGGREHVFTVSGDRKTWFELSVFVPDEGVRAWEAAHRRRLAENERYALAKMALFDAFDSRENPEAMRAAVEVPAPRIAELLSRVGLD